MFKATLIQLLAVPLGLYALILLLLFFFQSRLIYFPSATIMATPRDVGLAYAEVKVDTSDGIALAGWLVPGTSDRILLFCHGNAGNISDRLESIQIFNRLGLSVLIFDYRGYGRSEGKTTEAGTYLDAEAAWEYLVQQKGFSANKILLFGRSLGGPIAAHLAAVKNPAALILESTFPSLPELGARLYRFFPVKWLARFKYATVDYLQRVTCPVLVVHSPDDEIVPFALGLRVYEAATEPKELLKIRGDHNAGFVATGEAYVNGLRSFIGRNVPPGK